MKPKFTLIGVSGGALAGALHVGVCAPGMVEAAPTGGAFALMLIFATCLVMMLLFLRPHLAGTGLGYALAIGLGYLLGRTDLAGFTLGAGMLGAGLVLTPIATFLAAFLPKEYR